MRGWHCGCLLRISALRLMLSETTLFPCSQCDPDVPEPLIPFPLLFTSSHPLHHLQLWPTNFTSLTLNFFLQNISEKSMAYSIHFTFLNCLKSWPWACWDAEAMFYNKSSFLLSTLSHQVLATIVKRLTHLCILLRQPCCLVWKYKLDQTNFSLWI